jgi:hypothetical protein
MSSQDTLELKNPTIAAVLAWLVPGLGHLYQGRIGKGILFAVCILGLFLFGFRQGDWRIVYFRWDKQEWRWHYWAQLGAGAVALPALAYKPEWRTWLPAQVRNFEVQPTNAELDNLHREYGNEIDIATVYTVIAGLLNILVIYDAFAGPALYAEEQKAKRRAEEDAAKRNAADNREQMAYP